MKKTNLAILAVLSLFALPTLSHAQSVVVYDEPMDSAQQFDALNARFEYNSENPEAGWAWVDVNASTNFENGTNQLSKYTYERRVPGLRYDAHAQQIIYQPANGSPVVCANVRESGFLFVKKKRAELTGKCVLKSVVERRPISENNHGETRAYGKVVMDVSM